MVFPSSYETGEMETFSSAKNRSRKSASPLFFPILRSDAAPGLKFLGDSDFFPGSLEIETPGGCAHCSLFFPFFSLSPGEAIIVANVCFSPP